MFWGYASGDGPGAAGAAAAAPVAARPEIVVAQAAVIGGQLVASWQDPLGDALGLTRVTLSCDGADFNTRAFVYVGPIQPENLVSGTVSGAFDENDPNQPIYVPEGTPVNVVWTTTNGPARARIEFVRL